MRLFAQKHSQQSMPCRVVRSNTAASRLNQHPAPMLKTQQTIDHEAVSQVMPPKLPISAPGDRDEQEADSIAETVMSTPANDQHGAREATQRSSTSTVLRQPYAERQDAAGQGAEAALPTTDSARHVETKLEGLSGGSPLPDSARAFFEPRFHHTFAAVRVHADAQAAGLARQLNARAFTLGRHIVVGSGEYAPDTSTGQRLLAHELAHVVQQERGQPRIQRLAINQKHQFQGRCGVYNVGWAFRLDNPAPDDGFIVQQIDRNEWIGNCPAEGAPGPLPTYWEAWFVEKNRKRDAGTIADGVTDQSSLDTPQPSTTGLLISKGTVKFFPKSITGDLESAWRAPRSGWGCLYPPEGQVPEAADLPSTYSQPAWWNTAPLEGPAERSVKVSWNCCDPDETKHTTDLIAKP